MHTGCSLQFGKLVKTTPSFLPSPKEQFTPALQGPFAHHCSLHLHHYFRPVLVHLRTCHLSSSRGQPAVGKTEEPLRCSGAKRQILPLERQTPKPSQGFLAHPTHAKSQLLRLTPPSEMMNSWSWFFLTLLNIC